MNAYPCCHAPSRIAAFRRRATGAAGWVVPGTVLALLPKCPACLAAYVALWTGVGLSISAAARVRTSLMVLSIALLMYFGARTASRVVARYAR
jgi:hypothetical protein